MKIRFLPIYLLSVGVLIVILHDAGYAQADEKAGFALSAGTQFLTGRPGRTVESSVNIVTVGTRKTSRFEISVVDLGQMPEGNVGPVESGLGAPSCAAWIEIIERLEIPAGGGNRNVPFSIPIPADARGAYYAFIQVGAGGARDNREK
jgi:hypothetical protein